MSSLQSYLTELFHERVWLAVLRDHYDLLHGTRTTSLKHAVLHYVNTCTPLCMLSYCERTVSHC